MDTIYNFFETHKSQMIYVLFVVAFYIILTVLTNQVHKWLLKKKEGKFYSESTSSMDLIKRILNTLWVVLGLVALNFIFADEQKQIRLQRDFRLIAYLGFLAVLTIVSASTANLWFKKHIIQKIARNDDPTAYKFLRYVVISVIIFAGILFGLLVFPSLRVVAQAALGSAGVLAIIIGVASQEALANLVGGFFIIMFKPFKIGDIIKVTDNMVGTVTDITLRHIIIRDFDNKMIVIPNSVINKEKLVNFNLGELKCCERMDIGISYDSNVKLAKQIMQEVCEKHPLIIDNRSVIEKKDGQPIVKTALTGFNDSSVTIRAWAWAKNFDDSFQLKCDVLEQIKERFELEGIEIPYPYHTIVMKKNKEQEDIEV